MVNIPPRTMVGMVAVQAAGHGAATAEQRIKTLEDQVAALMAVIKIAGANVEVKAMGRLDIKAGKVDISTNHPSSVTSHNVAIARKGDRVTGTTYGSPSQQVLGSNCRVL